MSAGCTKGINLSFSPYKCFKYPKLVTSDTSCKKTCVRWGLGGKISRVKKKKGETLLIGCICLSTCYTLEGYACGLCFLLLTVIFPKQHGLGIFGIVTPTIFAEVQKTTYEFSIWRVEFWLLTYEDPLGLT